MRILATSDLHMQMTVFDYVRDRSATGGSLAKLATLIKRARSEATQKGCSCLLFDNGDTFQGTPMSDYMAHQKIGAKHPMVACMKYLDYDAGGLGNHDFDHGLDFLQSYLAQHDMPVVCSNLSSERLTSVRTSEVLDVPVTPNDPGAGRIRVGILSSLPDKTALWNRHHLDAQARFDPPLPVLREQASALRAGGADLIIVLAHMGLAVFNEGDDAQNLVSDVARLPDVDVVVGGHTHLRFPGPDHSGLRDVDCEAGTVHGKPVVQPGASASDLGIIDLELVEREDTSGWAVQASRVSLAQAGQETTEDPKVVALTRKRHDQTRRFLSQTVAELPCAMNSFFALVAPSPIPALLADAKRKVISAAIAGTRYEDLPLLSVASAPLTGGFDGPENFLDLAAGPLRRHHVAGMNPYANYVWALKTDGAQLVDWLERSAMIYNTLVDGDGDQMIVDPHVPGFRYDAIYGLTYEIDPRRPPLYDKAGKRMAGRSGRVRNVMWNGEPLRATQEFLVATTDHRAGGGGIYRTFGAADIVLQGKESLQNAVLGYLRSEDPISTGTADPWRFAPDLERTAILLTSPLAENNLAEIAHLAPEPCGLTADGFLKLRLHL